MLSLTPLIDFSRFILRFSDFAFIDKLSLPLLFISFAISLIYVIFSLSFSPLFRHIIAVSPFSFIATLFVDCFSRQLIITSFIFVIAMIAYDIFDDYCHFFRFSRHFMRDAFCLPLYHCYAFHACRFRRQIAAPLLPPPPPRRFMTPTFCFALRYAFIDSIAIFASFRWLTGAPRQLSLLVSRLLAAYCLPRYFADFSF